MEMTPDPLVEEAEALVEVAAGLDDDAAWLRARVADLENRAFELVGRFEVSRESAMSAQARVHAAELDEEVDLVDARGDLTAEEARKREIWAEVEALWSESRACALRAERKSRDAQRARGVAEQLLAQCPLETAQARPVASR